MAKFLPLRLGFIKSGFAVAVHWFCLGACVCRGFCCPVAFLSLFFGLDSAMASTIVNLRFSAIAGFQSAGAVAALSEMASI